MLTLIHFYPRSPRGERLAQESFHLPSQLISIHAPRVGSDFAKQNYTMLDNLFLSTLPAWGATAL